MLFCKILVDFIRLSRCLSQERISKFLPNSEEGSMISKFLGKNQFCQLVELLVPTYCFKIALRWFSFSKFLKFYYGDLLPWGNQFCKWLIYWLPLTVFWFHFANKVSLNFIYIIYKYFSLYFFIFLNISNYCFQF